MNLAHKTRHRLEGKTISIQKARQKKAKASFEDIVNHLNLTLINRDLDIDKMWDNYCMKDCYLCTRKCVMNKNLEGG